jgi:hypothetical protein
MEVHLLNIFMFKIIEKYHMKKLNLLVVHLIIRINKIIYH